MGTPFKDPPLLSLVPRTYFRWYSCWNFPVGASELIPFVTRLDRFCYSRSAEIPSWGFLLVFPRWGFTLIFCSQGTQFSHVGGLLFFSFLGKLNISKVSGVISDWRTFEVFIFQSTISCLNALLIFLVLTMHGLIYHFTDEFLTWAIKCPRFVEVFFCWQYALDLLHWSKSRIALTSFFSVFFDGDVTLDTILDMAKVFLSSVYFILFYFQQMLHVTIFLLLFVLGYYIGISFWKYGSGHRHDGYNFSMIHCNGKCSTAWVWTFPRR